jgi:hypothetical protein
MFFMLSEKECMRRLIHSLSGRAISPIESVSISQPDEDRKIHLLSGRDFNPPSNHPISTRRTVFYFASQPYGNNNEQGVREYSLNNTLYDAVSIYP